MSVKRMFLAGGVLALASMSADAALTFTLERVPSNSGAAGPSTVLLVARDPEATAPVNIAGLSGTFTNTTTANGLKFNVPDPDSGDVDLTGGVNNLGFGARRPAVLGTFLDVPSRTVAIVTATAPNGAPVDAANDGRFQTGMRDASFVSSRTNNTTLSVAALTGSGAVLGAAVVSSENDVVTFTRGSFGAVDASGNALPDTVIPALSTADSPIPEPTSLAVLGLAGGALLGRRRRQA